MFGGARMQAVSDHAAVAWRSFRHRGSLLHLQDANVLSTHHIFLSNNLLFFTLDGFIARVGLISTVSELRSKRSMRRVKGYVGSSFTLGARSLRWLIELGSVTCILGLVRSRAIHSLVHKTYPAAVAPALKSSNESLSVFTLCPASWREFEDLHPVCTICRRRTASVPHSVVPK
jgi:hypothetical protein